MGQGNSKDETKHLLLLDTEEDYKLRTRNQLVIQGQLFKTSRVETWMEDEDNMDESIAVHHGTRELRYACGPYLRYSSLTTRVLEDTASSTIPGNGRLDQMEQIYGRTQIHVEKRLEIRLVPRTASSLGSAPYFYLPHDDNDNGDHQHHPEKPYNNSQHLVGFVEREVMVVCSAEMVGMLKQVQSLEEAVPSHVLGHAYREGNELWPEVFQCPTAGRGRRLRLFDELRLAKSKKTFWRLRDDPNLVYERVWGKEFQAAAFLIPCGPTLAAALDQQHYRYHHQHQHNQNMALSPPLSWKRVATNMIPPKLFVLGGLVELVDRHIVKTVQHHSGEGGISAEAVLHIVEDPDGTQTTIVRHTYPDNSGMQTSSYLEEMEWYASHDNNQQSFSSSSSSSQPWTTHKRTFHKTKNVNGSETIVEELQKHSGTTRVQDIRTQTGNWPELPGKLSHIHQVTTTRTISNENNNDNTINNDRGGFGIATEYVKHSDGSLVVTRQHWAAGSDGADNQHCEHGKGTAPPTTYYVRPDQAQLFLEQQ